jgi:hypothetical protein
MTTTAPRTPQTVWDFVDTFLVTCPRCAERATVHASTESTPARLLCTACGLQREWVCRKKGVRVSGKASAWEEGAYVLGGPADPYFHHPLWLQAPCCGHTLWAYNRRHLAFLRAYVAATDRRRAERDDKDSRNRLLESRLPRWMKAAKNRDAVVRGLAALEEKLPTPPSGSAPSPVGSRGSSGR